MAIWQGADNLSTSGFSELKESKEKECDDFFAPLFLELYYQINIWKLKMIFPSLRLYLILSFISFSFLFLMKLIYCLGTSSPV